MKKKKISISIDDWMAEYLNFVTEEYEFSTSEAIRIMISISSHEFTRSLYRHFDKDVDLLKYSVKNIKIKPPETVHEAVCFNGKRAWEYRKRKGPKPIKRIK